MNINPITTVISYFKNRKEAKARKRKELVKLRQMYIEKNEKEFYQQGFNKITFPILIVEGKMEDFEFEFYYGFNIVWDLNEFSNTSWYNSYPLDEEYQLIDCNCEIWDFKYNSELRASTPGSILKKMELYEIKQFVIDSVDCYKMDAKIKDAVERANSMSELFEGIRPHYS